MRSCVGILAALVALPIACRRVRRRAPTVSLWFGGDTHLGARAHALFDRAPAELRGAVGVVNLEGPLEDAPPQSTPRRLTSSTRSLAALREAGVRVVTVANNHSHDLGDDGLARTVAAVRSANLTPAGGPAGDATLTVYGRRLVIAARDLTDGVPSDLAGSFARARRDGGTLIVTFHVTAPALYLPTSALREATRISLEAGARVVVAHGTHSVAPAERRGQSVIAWGLGNLTFDCDCTRETEGMIVRVDLWGAHTRARVIPIDAGINGAPATLAREPAALYDLLATLGSTTLRRQGRVAFF